MPNLPSRSRMKPGNQQLIISGYRRQCMPLLKRKNIVD
jgi:hypothetical protein